MKKIAIVISELLLCFAGIAQETDSSRKIKNIVLVHGAFVDGSGWQPVYELLVKEGYNVSIVQQPASSTQPTSHTSIPNPPSLHRSVFCLPRY